MTSCACRTRAGCLSRSTMRTQSQSCCLHLTLLREPVWPLLSGMMRVTVLSTAADTRLGLAAECRGQTHSTAPPVTGCKGAAHQDTYSHGADELKRERQQSTVWRLARSESTFKLG